MGSTLNLAKVAWRDSVIAGVPASGPNDPSKTEIIAAMADADARMGSAETRLATLEAGTAAAVKHTFAKAATVWPTSARVLPFDGTRSSLTLTNTSPTATLYINDMGKPAGFGLAGSYVLGPLRSVTYSVGETPRAAIYAASTEGGSPLKISVSNTSGADPWIDDFVALLPTPITAARKTLVGAYRGALLEAGILDLLDVMHVGMVADVNNALINWANPGVLMTRKGATLPTFTTDRGFQSDGSTGYVDTGVVCPGGNMSRTSASFFAYTLDLTQHSGAIVAAGFGAGTVQPNRGASLHAMRTIGSTNNQITLANDRFVGWTRSSSAQATTFAGANSSSYADDNSAYSLTPGNLFMFATNNAGAPSNFANYALCALFAGAYLSDAQVAILRSATLTFAQGVGAA